MCNSFSGQFETQRWSRTKNLNLTQWKMLRPTFLAVSIVWIVGKLAVEQAARGAVVFCSTITTGILECTRYYLCTMIQCNNVMLHSIKDLWVSICIVFNSSRDKHICGVYYIVLSCAYFSVVLFFISSSLFISQCMTFHKNKVKIASEKCRINHICFQQKPFPKIYMHAVVFPYNLCFLEYLAHLCVYVFLLSFFRSFFKSKGK